jgi:hypothetical protein
MGSVSAWWGIFGLAGMCLTPVVLRRLLMDPDDRSMKSDAIIFGLYSICLAVVMVQSGVLR